METVAGSMAATASISAVMKLMREGHCTILQRMSARVAAGAGCIYQVKVGSRQRVSVLGPDSLGAAPSQTHLVTGMQAR